MASSTAWSRASTPRRGPARGVALSVLFEQPDRTLDASTPAWASDLRLDQLAELLAPGVDESDLRAVFWSRLGSVAAVTYRQDVFRDLEDDELFRAIEAYVSSIAAQERGRAQLETLRSQREREGRYLELVAAYLETVRELDAALDRAALASQALVALRRYVGGYLRSEEVRRLGDHVRELRRALEAVRYTVHIAGSRVSVGRLDDQADETAAIRATFERFSDPADAAEQPEGLGRRWLERELNPIEARILDLVAALFREEFTALAAFYERERTVWDPTLLHVAREFRFYLAYRALVDPLRELGLDVCYPLLTEEPGQLTLENAYELVLAHERAREGVAVVTNDVSLGPGERIIVVTGPNQGGKTTFARSLGQACHLASLGCPVPGSRGRLTLVDTIASHFSRAEQVGLGGGKLEDDLDRLAELLGAVTDRSLVVLNEVFSATSLDDALVLGGELMALLVAKRCTTVFVTFLDELSTFDSSVVSMVSEVVPQRPLERTFKVVRRPADGLAFALALAEHHGLTYRQLRERLAR